MKPYISIALIAVSSLWSLDVVAWTCTQKCPSSVFSGKLECKLYQSLPSCSSVKLNSQVDGVNTTPPSDSKETSAAIQGQITLPDDLPDLKDATVTQNGYPTVNATPNINGQFTLPIPAEVLDAEKEGAVEKQKAAVPEYKTKEITVEIADGAPQPRFSPIPEGKGWTGKYKIKYRNGAIPTVTFPSYTRDKFNIIDIDKIVVKKLKTERWLLELYYNNSTLPSTQVLKELPAYLKNLPVDLR